MESSSDGMFDLGPGISFSSMRQPPLIKQLKGILSEYPDGGQILKELLQNAEDAEATEVNILYDARQISHPSTAQGNFNKFFKGPALCVANNAIFTEKDWEGIRMIYSSVKEDDRSKVGRFGLGFKSVFHITDYPCVISGGKVLMIDPQQPSDRVNAMVDLSQIGKLEKHGLNAKSFWDALDGAFGMTRKNIKDYYHGTLFWFPLRRSPSELSETLYDEAKVMDLFEAIQKEASSILLFLKNLESINIYKRENENLFSEIIKIEIKDSNGEVRKNRLNFKEKINKVSSAYQGNDIWNDVQISIAISTNRKRHIFEWIVVNYYVGKSADSSFRKLIQDEDFSYSPYVGVAAPLGSFKQGFEGHVFCFLPLPREGSRLTGLPVHVNGFFALSQNRHHMKLETEEQRGKRIEDKSLLWNKYLISQAIPLAYQLLVNCLIQRSMSYGNVSDLIEHIYACLPDSKKTQNTWVALEKAVYTRLFAQRFLYCAHLNTWIQINEACFATFSSLPREHKHVKDAVRRCLSTVGMKYVDIPLALFDTIGTHFCKLHDLTPNDLAKYLQWNDGYRNMACLEKLDILEYILSETDYRLVNGLELLPLSSEKWRYFDTYGKHTQTIYACSGDILKILPGLHDNFLKKTTLLRNSLAHKIEGLCCSGVSQIKEIDTYTVKFFLNELMKRELGTSTSLSLTGSSILTMQWLNDVWTFVINRGIISSITTLPLVPVLAKGLWKSPKIIHLVKLNDLLLLKSKNRELFEDEAYTCFKLLGVILLESLPSWIPLESIQDYCFYPNPKSINTLISEIGRRQNANEVVANFNKRCPLNDRDAFKKILEKCQFEMSEDVKMFTRKLKLFRAVKYINGRTEEASISDISTFIYGTERFPNSVMLPFTCLQVNKSFGSLVTTLGGKKVSIKEIIVGTLENAKMGLLKDEKEFRLFIQYFLENFHFFKSHDTIVSLAKNLRFLETGHNSHMYLASELFDPTDKILDDLLYGESLIPDSKYIKDDEAILALKSLGLKGLHDIDCMVLFRVANTLDNYDKKLKGKNNKDVVRKAKAFMHVISLKHTLLKDFCQNSISLTESIESLACILAEKRVSSYPSCLNWFQRIDMLCRPYDAKDVSLSLLVGGIMPMVECMSEPLAEVFGWKDPPVLSNIFEQLRMVRKCHSVQNRSEIMPVIKSIYDHLSTREEEVSSLKDELAEDEIVWTGKEFVTPNRMVVVKQGDDLDLHPYLYSLPEEYMCIQTVFLSLGCPLKQDICMLQNTLKCIRTINGSLEGNITMKRDKRIVFDILEKIASLVLDGFVAVDNLDILMMVHDKSNPSGFKLRPVTECTYDDDPTSFFDDNENTFLVHEMISIETAEVLGVKSISRNAALDAEELGVEEWGQQEHLTTRIHALIRDGYTDGLSVPKELIQNADDAGATTIKFLYDERQNLECRERVLYKGMRAFQGPALWVYNDATFSDADLKNITKLNAATKQADVRKIGKFGLGFCSVYNLTDLPSLITGSHIVFFDPHEKHLGSIRGTGLKYTLPNRTLLSRHSDQFKPYDGVFGCQIGHEEFTKYDGTLFRLPLRTGQQAKESKIYSVSYTREEMTKLLQMLILAAGNMLLFSQNVKSIEIFHLKEESTDASEPSLLFEIRKNVFRLQNRFIETLPKSVLSRMPQFNERSFSEIHKTVFNYRTTKKCKALINGLENFDEHLEAVWLLSWARGSRRSLQVSQKLSSEGAVPLAAVAIPCKDKINGTPISIKDVGPVFYPDGHIFCFLPLPIKTKLLVQVNGCFAVTSDRRQLVSKTEDDKCSKGSTWNHAVLEDALVISFIKLLERLSEGEINVDQTYNYYTLWPADCSNVLLQFKDAFYRNIIDTKCKLFQGNGSWVCFQDCVFLDPKFRKNSQGGIAFDFLSHISPWGDKTVIEMPEYVFENIKQRNMDRTDVIHSAVVCEKDFFQIFFENICIPFWEYRYEERNMIIALALKAEDTAIGNLMQQIECIPTSPHQNLRFPSKLINPYSSLRKLFSVNDERFPYDDKLFRNELILRKLTEIGMNGEILPNSILIDRCHSIQILAECCCICARERCTSLMDYLSRTHVLKLMNNDTDTLKFLRNTCIIPVLQRPKTWAFSWGADSSENDFIFFDGRKHCNNHAHSEPLRLGKSEVLARQTLCDCIGSVSCLIDETFFPVIKGKQINIEKLFKMLCVKDRDSLKTQVLIDQICLIVREYQGTITQFDEFKRIHNTLFNHFNDVIKNDPENVPECFNALRHVRVIPIETKLVKAENIALNVKVEYAPFLYRLPDTAKIKWKHICKYLGVKDHFDIHFIIKIIDSLRGTWQRDRSNVEKISALLQNLSDVMAISNTHYDNLNDYHDIIVAPDSHCQLWPTYELASENLEFKANTEMKILHRDIPVSLGELLGVKTKELKCFESISVGVSFGQREKLVTRINGLLKAYPCDASIMKEILQNADDAGATEIHFVKDYRSHSTKTLFSKSCASLQGPALCVYNNSYFTKEDIEGIHNLGQGSKREDPTKTGQYGVGFNAVYHLTDTPSFISKGPNNETDEFLVVFDPLLSCLPKATIAEPGQMFKVSDVQNNFPDHLLGFSHDKLIKDENGTVFRFPLRSASSDIEGEVIDTVKMDSILSSFKQEMKEAVLFLKNVTCLKISKIVSKSGEMVEEYSVNVDISEKSIKDRISFNNYVQTVVRKNKDTKERNLDGDHREVIYPMTVMDSMGCKYRYLIVQQFGNSYKTNKIEKIKALFINGDLGLIPVGGVAIPLNNVFKISEDATKITEVQTSKRTSTFGKLLNLIPLFNQTSLVDTYTVSKETKPIGKAFCFLPLPLNTGLPVHVNGHFALDHESRRDLWKDGFRMEWNMYILEDIIVPSWINGILDIQNDITNNVEMQNAWCKVNDVLKKYHLLFPVHSDSTSKLWKEVTSQFYTHIFDKKMEMFPCVFDRKNDNCPQPGNSDVSNRFRLTWTHVNSTSDTGGYFNDVYSRLPRCMSISDNEKKANWIGGFLKSIGMKLIETPNSLKTEMHNAGLKNIPVSSPDAIISFFNGISCDIGSINVDISASKYRTEYNLLAFIDFISYADCFAAKISGLPLLLTQDNILRRFSEDHKVFITRFARLLPGSSNHFANLILTPILTDPKILESGVCKNFSFQDFTHMLPDTMQKRLYASGREIRLQHEGENIPDSIPLDWLYLLYEFLCDQSMKKTDSQMKLKEDNPFLKTDVDKKKFRLIFKQLNEWSFLPCVKQNTHQFLGPIYELPHMLHLSYSEKQEKLGCVLQKLKLPSVNFVVFEKSPLKSVFRSSISACIPSLKSPLEILECLVYYKEKIRDSEEIIREESTEILAYFQRKLSLLCQHADKYVVAGKLRELPLFFTLHGTLVSLDSNNDVVVIPKGMPFVGIQELANECEIILLQDNDSLHQLFEILQLRKADIEIVYYELILPNLDVMPIRYWITHITFLRDRLSLGTNNPVQEKIMEQIAQKAFIKVDGIMKRVNQLYDFENEVFRYMKCHSDSPPNIFLTYNWKYFLKQLGLICEVTDEMLIQFAYDIANESTLRLNTDFCKKSEILLETFVKNRGMNWKKATLDRIKSIGFIKCHVVERHELDTLQQYSANERMICFAESVSSLHSNLCWTSCNLLPSSIFDNLHEKVRAILEIYEQPPLNRVILHCQNVCDVLKQQLKAADFEREDLIEYQMTCFYEYFTNQIRSQPGSYETIKSRLQDKPFIHLKEEKDLILLRQIVTNLPSHLEVKPYLYQAPVYYGKYISMFEKLGSKKHIMFSNYAYIMQNIKDKCKDLEMNPVERSIAQKALRNLFNHTFDKDESINEVKSIYLPNQDLILLKSNEIVVSDSIWFLKRLQGHLDIDLFAGIEFLDMKDDDVEIKNLFTNWPSHLMPIFLTDCVEEVISASNKASQSMTSNKSLIIENFIHSPELLSALGGILKRQFQCSRQGEMFKDSIVSDAEKKLKAVKCYEILSLRTVLKYNGSIISGSEMAIPYHIKTNVELSDSTYEVSFYVSNADTIDDETTTDFSHISDGLLKLIQACVTQLNFTSLFHVTPLLQVIASPEKIPALLQRLEIQPLFLSNLNERDYFPKPGTYVESRFIPFLEQGIQPFKEYEFNSVAMEVSDETIDFDRNDPVYIYVRILKECEELSSLGDLGRMYIVRTGNPDILSEQVPIFRLYRFVRREEDPGREMQRFDSEPINSKPFDEQCRLIRKLLIEAWKLPKGDRKRVERRLFFKWHPDKNPGNEEYCKKVFQYIQIVISRLENGENLTDNTDDEMSRGPSGFSPSASSYYDDLNERARTYARAFHDNYDDYCSFNRTGHYSHSHSQHIPRPDLAEAERWLRQSKNDFKAAEAMLPVADGIDGYNWICYLCHQSCEKALKSARYSKDANNVPRGSDSHCLTSLMSEPAMYQQAQLLESRLGEHTRLRYPDTVNHPRIPSDIFQRDDAEFSIDVARKMINIVEEYIS